MPLLCLAGAVIFSLPVLAGREFLKVRPWQNAFRFENPRSALMAPDGSLLVSDRGERRLVGLDASGQLRYIVNGEQRQRGFYNARLVGFDSLGRFYLDDTVNDADTGNVESRRLLRFSANGHYLGTVLEFGFSGEASFDWETHPIFAQIVNDQFYWFKKNDQAVWQLLTLDLRQDQAMRVVPLADVDPYNAIAATVVSPAELYFLNYDGSIDSWQLGQGRFEWLPAADSQGRSQVGFPTGLGRDHQQHLLVADGKAVIKRFGRQPGGISFGTVFDGWIPSDSGSPQRASFQAFTALPDGGLLFCDEHTGRLIRQMPSGDLHIIESARFGPTFRLLHLGVWLATLLAGLSLAAAVILFYGGLSRRRTPLVFKQLFIMLPVIALMVTSVALYVYGTLAVSLETQQRDRLLHLAHYGAGRFDPDGLANIDFSAMGYRELLESPDVRSAVTVLDELVNRNEDPWTATIYPYLYIKQQGSWWIIGSFDYIEPYPYDKTEFNLAAETGQYQYFRYNDVYGTWLSAIVPVRDQAGRTLAVFEVSMSADFMAEARAGFARRAAIGGGGILVIFLAMLGGFTYLLLRSVKKLQQGVERVAAGDYEITVNIDSGDELEDLGKAFNGMSGEIKNYIEQLAAFNRANSRFVPKEFLDRIGRETITEVSLGDQIMTDMTVLFSDIRGFTALSEQLGPENTISLLNNYLSRMGPIIRSHGGFIDKYIGDAIMALFPGPVDNAVEAMLGMMKSLDTFQSEMAAQGKPITDSGFAIHSGPLMLGIIGETERFEGTVIADTVNLASRLESLTKYYGVRSLLSGLSVKHLVQREHKPIRFIDAVQVKGKKHAVLLYELIGHGDPARGVKIKSVKLYKQAFRHYCAGEFETACQVFQAILDTIGFDQPTQILLERSRYHARNGKPENWRGVTVFQEK